MHKAKIPTDEEIAKAIAEDMRIQNTVTTSGLTIAEEIAIIEGTWKEGDPVPTGILDNPTHDRKRRME